MWTVVHKSLRWNKLLLIFEVLQSPVSSLWSLYISLMASPVCSSPPEKLSELNVFSASSLHSSCKCRVCCLCLEGAEPCSYLLCCLLTAAAAASSASFLASSHELVSKYVNLLNFTFQLFIVTLFNFSKLFNIKPQKGVSLWQQKKYFKFCSVCEGKLSSTGSMYIYYD